MTVRIRFEDGVLDGRTEDFAPDDALEQTVMFVGAGVGPANGRPISHRYDLSGQDEHGVHVWRKTAAVESGSDSATSGTGGR